jgi:hypothetical protein
METRDASIAVAPHAQGSMTAGKEGSMLSISLPLFYVSTLRRRTPVTTVPVSLCVAVRGDG